MYPTKDLIVKFVDEHKFKGVGIFHKVYVQIKEIELQTRFYALPTRWDGYGVRRRMVDIVGNFYHQHWKESQQIYSSQQYNLYDDEGFSLKKYELELLKKRGRSTYKHITMEARHGCIQETLRFYIKWPS